MPWHMCGGQRTTSESPFSPSTMGPVNELVFRLRSELLYPQGHPSGPLLIFIHMSFSSYLVTGLSDWDWGGVSPRDVFLDHGYNHVHIQGRMEGTGAKWVENGFQTGPGKGNEVAFRGCLVHQALERPREAGAT